MRLRTDFRCSRSLLRLVSEQREEQNVAVARVFATHATEAKPSSFTARLPEAELSRDVQNCNKCNSAPLRRVLSSSEDDVTP